jgi:hypothetical protein
VVEKPKGSNRKEVGVIAGDEGRLSVAVLKEERVEDRIEYVDSLLDKGGNDGLGFRLSVLVIIVGGGGRRTGPLYTERGIEVSTLRENLLIVVSGRS